MKHRCTIGILIIASCSFSGLYAQKADTVVTKLADGHEYMKIGNAERIFEDGYLLNGQHDGSWTTYWQDGYPHDITIYRNGKKNGLHMQVDVTGYASLMESYTDNVLNGPRRVFNKGAQRSEEGWYLNGLKDGPFKRWYFAGTIQEESNFVKDKREGKATWYFDNKNKAAEYSYKDGKIDGEVTTYYENGKVSEISTYKDDVQTGDAKEFYENGNMKAEGQYKDGKKEGKWKQYDDEGKYTKTIKYKNGEEK